MAERSFSGQVDGVVTYKNWLVIERSRVRYQQPQKLFLEKLPLSAHTKKNRGHKSSLACFKRSDEAKSWHTRPVGGLCPWISPVEHFNCSTVCSLKE